MEILRTIAELDALANDRVLSDLVLVPTMGALHDGHVNLVETAIPYGPVIVSIFVNPLQFGPGEDFESYPRDLDADLAKLAALDVRAVFVPEAGDIYPSDGATGILPGYFADGLCGEQRPGHFAGVLTIVAKLFNLIEPSVAVFGRKDAQQCLVINQMVRDLNMGIRIIDAPTVREADGLAMSSRNQYLTAADRAKSLCLSRGLRSVRGMLEKGERRPGFIEDVLQFVMAEADDIEYSTVRRVDDFKVPETLEGRILIAVAARIGQTRLIDNSVLMIDESSVTETSLLEI